MADEVTDHVWEGYGFYTIKLSTDGSFVVDCQGAPAFNGVASETGDQDISIQGVDTRLLMKYGDPEPLTLKAFMKAYGDEHDEEEPLHGDCPHCGTEVGED